MSRRTRTLLGATGAIIATTTAACVIEPPRPPSYVVLNGTDLVVEIRYQVDRPGLSDEELEALRSVANLDPGEETRFGRLGNDEDTCLDAPLVALGPDGEEVDRLIEGTCADRDVRPTWIVSDEG